MAKLWENPNPGSSFAAQTISLSLSGYSIIMILFVFSTSEHLVLAPIIIPTAINTQFRATDSDNVNKTLSRPGKITATGVHFEDGFYNGGTDNGLCIPYQIWGIRA